MNMLHLPQYFKGCQRGFVSVLSVLALASVVLVILAQSVQLYGTKALESQEYYDSVAALAVAESGTEIAKALIDSSCTLTTPASNTVGSGTFSILSAQPDGTGCKFRVKGTVKNANRTIETKMSMGDDVGTSGYGTTPTLTVSKSKDWPVKATVVFDLAWRAMGSEGHPDTIKTNVTCLTCDIDALWTDYIPGTSNGIGGVGNSLKIDTTGVASVTKSQTLSSARNYVMVGLAIGGSTSDAPSPVGGWTFVYNNNSSATIQTANSTSKGGLGCTDVNANALVLGVSTQGPGNNNFKAAFDSVDLNGMITTTMWGNRYVHYPNTDGTSPNAKADVFAEIFYYFKNPVLVSGATGQKTKSTITIDGDATALLKVNDYIRADPYLAENTYIKNIAYSSSSGKTTLTINNNIKNDMAAGTLCSGLCSLPSTTTLKLNGNSDASQTVGWVAGIACMKDVNPLYVKVVSTSHPHALQWHEVISGE